MLDDLMDMVGRAVYTPAGGPLTEQERTRLARLLLPGETIDAHVRGRDDEDRLLWLATSRRLLLIEREWLGDDVKTIEYGTVHTAETRAHGARASVWVHTLRKRHALHDAEPTLATTFVQTVRSRMEGRADGRADAKGIVPTGGLPIRPMPMPGAAGPSAPTAPTADVAPPAPPPFVARDADGRLTDAALARLHELLRLRDLGGLTADEFEAEKRRLLST